MQQLHRLMSELPLGAYFSIFEEGRGELALAMVQPSDHVLEHGTPSCPSVHQPEPAQAFGDTSYHSTTIQYFLNLIVIAPYVQV